MILAKGSKKLINAWAFYDWANSVYSLVISTAVFPIYYSSLTESFANVEGDITFLGTTWNPTTLYDYILAISFLIVAFFSPILSGIADYSGDKLRFLKGFCWLGSISVMSLYFFEGPDTLWIGLLGTVLASVGFWGSIVFYNAYLPEVAFPEQQDNVSAKGFIYGYTGSIILLVFSLIMVNNPEIFGLSGAGMASRVTFLIVGIWWVGFAQFTYRKLPKSPVRRKITKGILGKGLHELKIVFDQIKEAYNLKMFLTSFFLYSVGVQTIILMAGIFGSKELGLATQNLIILILLVQFVAIAGAFLFSRISDKLGNFSALKITIAIWGIVCFIAYSLDKSMEYIELYFYGLGALIGLVLGAIQSLSRSTYSKLLPDTEDHATYFSFFDVTEKIAIVFGMFVFGLLISITGSMQWSVLFLAVFFLISFVLMSFVRKTKYVR